LIEARAGSVVVSVTVATYDDVAAQDAMAIARAHAADPAAATAALGTAVESASTPTLAVRIVTMPPTPSTPPPPVAGPPPPTVPPDEGETRAAEGDGIAPGTLAAIIVAALAAIVILGLLLLCARKVDKKLPVPHAAAPTRAPAVDQSRRNHQRRRVAPHHRAGRCGRHRLADDRPMRPRC